MTPAEVDFSIARTARLQHGVISHAQALDAGATDRMIEGRLSTRRWVALAPAVYALAGNPFTWHRQCMAAVLGEVKAVISRRAAATLHEFPSFRPGPIDVTVPRWSNHRSPLAVVHESNLVQRTTVDRIPTVSAAQALIEVARFVDEQRLGALLDELDQRERGRLLPAVQDRYVDLARARWPGIARMRSVLSERDQQGYVPHDSLLEAKLWAILGRLRPRPAMIRQAPLPWRPQGASRVDVLIPSWSAIIEADGRRWHTRVRDFDVDQERNNEAVLNGFRTLRFTWSQITTRPEWVRREVDRLRPDRIVAAA